MKPLRLFLAGTAALACGVWAGLSISQVVPSPGPPTGIACAYNTSPPTLTDKQAGWVQCDSSGKVIVSGLTGSVSNASSGVATSSTNIGAVSWLYGFNGTTWDQLQVDASKFLKVNCAAGCGSGTFNNNSDNVATSATNGQAAAWLYVWDGSAWDRLYGDSTNGAKVNVTNANANGQAAMANSSPVVLASNQSVADPCTFQAKTNLPISQNGTSSVQLIALSGSTSIYVCSMFLMTNSTATTFAITTGTGSACVTGNAAVVGTTTANIANSMNLITGAGYTLGNGGGTVAKGAASSELCLILGSNVFVSGNLTYVQQ